MRVIHLLESSRFSGAENVICQIIGMFNIEDDVEFFYCSRDGQIREALEERHVKFIPIKELSIKEVRRVIKEYSPDIIHAHDMRASYVAACSTMRIPIISHIHNNSFESRGMSLKSIAYLYAGCRAKHIFWVSDSAFKGYVFHNILKRKSEILYNIIYIEALYSKMKKDDKSYQYEIVYLGRLTVPKNPHRLLSVFKKIADKEPEIKIAVIGTGELENEVLKEATELNLAPNVEFLGFLNNPYKILYDSKVMLMTSLWEGTPMCVLEAMSLGVPVVSTPTDGVSIVVENNETGFLSDSDEQLASKCLEIVNNNVLHNTMSKKSIIRAENLMDKQRYRDRLKEAYFKCS